MRAGPEARHSRRVSTGASLITFASGLRGWSRPLHRVWPTGGPAWLPGLKVRVRRSWPLVAAGCCLGFGAGSSRVSGTGENGRGSPFSSASWGRAPRRDCKLCSVSEVAEVREAGRRAGAGSRGRAQAPSGTPSAQVCWRRSL